MGNTIKLTAYEKSQVPAIKQYIKEHLHQPLTATSIADHFEISVYKLEASFIQETEQSLTAFIKECRLEAGRLLLETSNKGVKEIAVICGYRHSYSFQRAFKNRFGFPPGRYRKR